TRSRRAGEGVLDTIQGHGFWIHVVIRVVAGEPMRALAAYISNFQRDAVGELMLNRGVISIHAWQSLLGRPDMHTGDRPSQSAERYYSVRRNCGEGIGRINAGNRVRPSIQSKDRDSIRSRASEPGRGKVARSEERRVGKECRSRG